MAADRNPGEWEVEGRGGEGREEKGRGEEEGRGGKS